MEASGRDARPCGWRCAGSGAVSPRAAEPVQSEVLARRRSRCAAGGAPGFSSFPACGDLGHGSLLAASWLLGAHPAAGFPRLPRRPGTRSSCGDGTPDPARHQALRASRLPHGRGFPERLAGRAAAPVGGEAAAGGAAGRRHGTPPLLASPAAPPVARGPGHTARSRFTVSRWSAGVAPKLRLGVNCTRPFFDPCLWCERAQISHPGPKECSL